MQNLLEKTPNNSTSPDLTLAESEILPVIEAILFAAARDVTLPELSKGLGIQNETKIVNLVKHLITLYESRPSGLMIRETAPETYILCPKVALLPKISVFMRDDLLDPNELRTLALIAYKQPITRAQLRKLRSCASKHLPKLMDLKFIHFELANDEEVLSTTIKFADYFGLSTEATDIKEILGVFLETQEID